ncbi:chorismate-binding protein [Brevibacterium album]|uniref:chorismate-binding protein n=1 Tax=Brevibacterium album TaxID=417948 RepID=UPI00041C0B62|nr:chorismate-binding protein [Brevibacterium album]
MTPTAQLLAELSTSGRPFALLSRGDGAHIEILTGELVTVEALADIPLCADDRPREVLALVPYCQIRERGFDVADDGTPLACLLVDEHHTLPAAEVLAALPAAPPPLREAGFDVSDEDYADTVSRVIAEEIGRGEGANFVIRRDYTARVDAAEAHTALAWFRALMEHETGAYWTFAVVTDRGVMAGASPEAHVIARGGTVTMNPISGTFRHPASGATDAALAAFLRDAKETEELFMVVDEEMKMMSAVCSDGGRITGPHLKRMSRLTHTEYVLRGASALDPREILRETMFAPTVTGSPMQNACAVIARHERGPRGYYSGVAGLFTPNGAGSHDLDAPILIRTAYLEDGRMRVPVGATLVRSSVPASEVAETHSKAAGVLGALGAIPRPGAPAGSVPSPVTASGTTRAGAELDAQLRERNSRLADFWLQPQDAPHAPPFAGRSALVVDAEDRFTTMLAHQLRHLGMEVRAADWDAVMDAEAAAADLLVAGPGPGDPRDAASARITRMRGLVARRRAAGRALLAVCLSHQLLAAELGLDLVPLDAPRQGAQLTVPLWGRDARLGFYNTFTARVSAPPNTGEEAGEGVAAPPGEDVCALGEGIEAAVLPGSGDVIALRGPGFASVQAHVESVLSTDGLHVLNGLVDHSLHAQ